MKHLTVMRVCDMLQDTRDRMLELDESQDAATLELLYQKYLKLYHEYLRDLTESTPIRKSST
jgi:hypothetical protein